MESEHPAGKWLGSRHGQSLLMFLGLTITYALRVNLSVGIVAMTDKSSQTDFPVLNWTTSEKGTVLSSFFWGYIVMQIPAGQLARRFGPSYILSATLLFCGLVTVLTPIAATHGGAMAVTATRVLQGLGQGFIYPSVNTHMSKWAVPEERGRLFSFVFGGTQLGSILMLIFGGLLAAGPGGWPSIFYISGSFAIAWGILCAFFAADSPRKHRTISDIERKYIESRLVHSSSNSNEMVTPWKEIVTSLPLLALLLTHLAQNWGFWTLLTLIPSYIGGVLHYDIKNNGLFSSLPYLAMWIATILCSFIADYINEKKLLSLNFSRKMWNSIAHYGGALALVGLGYVTNTAGAITLLTISVACNCGTYFGYLTNHLDLSPNFAGTLMGITNGIATITAIIAPIVAGVIVKDESSASQWQIVFLISAAIFFVGNTIFIFFGSTEVQPWNVPKTKKDEKTLPT